MTWKSSSEQSFKLAGIALMIVKVSRGMGERRDTDRIIFFLSAQGTTERERERESVAEIIINFNRATHHPPPPPATRQ